MEEKSIQFTMFDHYIYRASTKKNTITSTKSKRKRNVFRYTIKSFQCDLVVYRKIQIELYRLFNHLKKIIFNICNNFNIKYIQTFNLLNCVLNEF